MDLTEELESLKKRISAIESRLGMTSAYSNPTKPPAAVIKVNEGNKFSSAKLLGVISVICFILACAFVIKLAVDSGWLTPVRQVGIATLMGSILIFFGFYLKDNDKEYASFLPASGVIILYLSTFGGHLYYGIFSDELATILTCVVSVLSIWLFTIFRSDIFAVSAAAGTYSVPLLIGFFQNDFSKLSLYFLGWSVTYSVISIFVKSRSLSIVASYFAIGIYGKLCVFNGFGKNGIAAEIQLLQFLVLLLGAVGFSLIHKAPLSKVESWSFYPILLFFYVTEYVLLEGSYNEAAPYIMLILGGAVYFSYWFAKNKLPGVESSKSLVESYCLITLFHSLYLELLPDQYRPILFIALLLSSVFVVGSKIRSTQSITGFLVVTSILLREYGSIIDKLINRTGETSLWILYGMVASALFLIKGIKERLNNSSSSVMLYFILGHTLFVSTLYGVFEQMGSLELSIAWTAYACAILWYGFTNKNEPLAKSSLAVLFFAVAKVFTYDVSNAAPTIRILCLLLTAVVLYGCGWLLKRIEGWEK